MSHSKDSGKIGPTPAATHSGGGGTASGREPHGSNSVSSSNKAKIKSTGTKAR